MLWQPVRLAHRVWRRSLQLRVVGATMVLGTLAVVVLGTVLLQRIEAGLIQERLITARGEANQGRQDAQSQLDTVEDTSDLNLFLNDVIRRLASPEPDPSRDIVMLRPVSNVRPDALPDLRTRAVKRSVIPDELRKRVETSGRLEEQFVRIRYDDSDRTVPGVAIGSLVEIPVAGPYELYAVFSLEREQQTLDLIRRILVIGGSLLVLLVGGVAYVVTRQVVRPVRQAATVAQRLASGKLTERMASRGEDDLARLAASFNTMAQSLQRQITQLERLSQVQQRFVSDVSHELRTPLTTVRMASDVLYEARTDFPPQIARSAELLTAELDRFQTLLQDLLEISRIDAGGNLLVRETVDIRDLVTSVVSECSSLAGTTGNVVSIITEVRDSSADSEGDNSHEDQDRTSALTADVDPRRIERILRNLLVNALEHGEGRGVQVTIGLDADVIAVVVRDYGVGLKPGEAALVFNRFWRADPSRARRVGGNGLGLAIALEDARLHGGWLQAWGEPGRGSCFRLTLPRHQDGHVVTSPLPLEPHDHIPAVGQPYQRIANASTALQRLS
ncbi:MAG: MtrAB system histidine kinase MtrB [Actinomycetota bacterium]